MNDHYDTNQDPESLTDHDQGLAGEGEAWTGEQPVDDFHAGEEAATVSEEMDMESENNAADDMPVQKKKSRALPIAAAIGGLLFLGAVVYWQFGMSPDMSAAGIQVPPLSTQNTVTPVPAPVPVAPPVSPVAAPENTVAPTTALTSTAQNSAAVAVPVAPAAVAVAPVVASSPDATVVALPPKPAAVTPVSAPVPVVAVPASAPVVVATPVTKSAPTPVRDESVDARLGALASNIGELQKSMEQVTTQLAQVSATMAAGSNPALDERLTKIEQRLDQMQHSATSSQTHSEPAASVSSYSSYKVTRPKHSSTRHASAKTRKPSRSRSEVASQPTVFVDWVLRAASPGEAWVATSAASPELKHIRVGDSLTGIGTVIAIHQNNGNWVIEGSKGTIR